VLAEAQHGALRPVRAGHDPACVHQVPLTLLSGFLGAGKTTTLKHVLENQEGKRVAVVVNDIAEVNIDFKLLRRKPVGEFDGDLDLSDTMELENGCADSRPLTGPVGRN
jgi:Flp pilus assembly CpaF family ATPase